jgi:hypothetical protein
MLLWRNYRPTKVSHDLVPIMENALYEFAHLKDIDNGYHLWSSSSQITVHDIAQGFTVGNCYFVSALAALADKPERIKKIFAKEF